MMVRRMSLWDRILRACQDHANPKNAVGTGQSENNYSYLENWKVWKLIGYVSGLQGKLWLDEKTTGLVMIISTLSRPF